MSNKTMPKCKSCGGTGFISSNKQCSVCEGTGVRLKDKQDEDLDDYLNASGDKLYQDEEGFIDID